MSNLILCGPKGVGKTTFGKKLAQLLSKPFYDTDDLLNQCPQVLYSVFGEQAFRELEREAIKQLKEVKDSIISVGGGALLEPDNCKNLKKIGRIIYIHMEKSAWIERVKECDSPILTGPLDHYYEERVSICRKVADMEISYGI